MHTTGMCIMWPLHDCHVTRHGMNAVLHACQSGHNRVVDTLISKEADINKQDINGWSVSTPNCSVGINVHVYF